MKTCTTRLTLERCISNVQITLASLVLCLTFLSSPTRVIAQCLDCTSQVVTCADPAAQLEGDPGYVPDILSPCTEDDVFTSVPWPVTIDKCAGSYSHAIYRMWRDLGGVTICTDTTYVLRINIMSDSLLCPMGVDTILCGIDPDPLDSLPLRAPKYGIPGVDTIPLLSDTGPFCGIYVDYDDAEWPSCGQTKVVMRTWTIHDDCGKERQCVDTLVYIDTIPPTVSFDTASLSLESHSFNGISGTYLTDTMDMASAGCVGHGILPYASVSDNCGPASSVSVSVLAVEAGIFHHYQGDEVPVLSAWNVEPEKEIVVYKSEDACHNFRYDTVIIVVADRTPGVAVCHDAVNLSLTNVDRYTLMKAGSMDAESYDNCNVYQILARRMDWETACGYDPGAQTLVGDFYAHFAEWIMADGGICQDVFEFGFATEVPFCCDDVNQSIMVEIMVIDNNCNVDRCWGLVNVEDKLAPVVVEPLPDVSITCNAYDEFYREIVENGDTTAIREAFGEYVLSVFDQETWTLHDLDCSTEALPVDTDYDDGLISDNCDGTYRERYSFVDGGCDASFFKREFIATIMTHDGPADVVYAIQKIHIEKCPLSLMGISLPVTDTTIYDCGVTWGLDGKVQIATPGPILPDNLPDCTQYGLGYYDKLFDIVSGQGCQKVLRTWCVVDWCQVGDVDNWSAISHLEGVLTFHQYIKVVDTVPPEINVLSMVADVQTSNCTGTVSSEIDATDLCGSEPFVEWLLKEQGGTIVDRGIGEVASPNLPLLPGNYILLWRARDNCNNVTEAVSNFSISSAAAPSVVAYPSLTTVLTPMDSNDNGVVDFGLAEIWAEEFNSSSAAPCAGDDEDIIFLLTAADQMDVPPDTATSLQFTCDDFSGNQTVVPLKFWVKDTAMNTAAFVEVFAVLLDNSNVCSSPEPPQVGISGSIFTEAGDEIANVKVRAQAGGDHSSRVTTADHHGHYNVGLAQGQAAMVTPEKDSDHANGISTLDLVKIQKHILDMKPIRSPYKLIAADANRDREIDPIDLIQLRKLVIGAADRLPQNTSWRFVDAAYQFKHPGQALTEDFPEYISVHQVGGMLTSKDFVGIKIGDLDDNVVTSRSAARGQEAIILQMADVSTRPGATYQIDIYANDLRQMEGLQLELRYVAETLKIKRVISGQIHLTDDMVHTAMGDHGYLRVSYSSGFSTTLVAEEPLFSLEVTGVGQARLSEAMALSSQHLSSEAYLSDHDVRRLSLQFVDSQAEEDVLTLGQNLPNPFRSETTIPFYVPADGEVTLSILDPAGTIVKSLVREAAKGDNRIVLDRDKLPAGMYYYTLHSAYGSATRKMILIE